MISTMEKTEKGNGARGYYEEGTVILNEVVQNGLHEVTNPTEGRFYQI